SRRRHTSFSRDWSSDVCSSDLLARDNLRAALSGTTPEGNLPCLMTGRDAWVDRSQPPIASFIVWMIYLRTGERSILEAYYPTLRSEERRVGKERRQRWWRSDAE